MRTVQTRTRRLGTKVTISSPEVVQVGDTVNDFIIGTTAFDAAGDTSLYNVNFLLLMEVVFGIHLDDLVIDFLRVYISLYTPLKTNAGVVGPLTFEVPVMVKLAPPGVIGPT